MSTAEQQSYKFTVDGVEYALPPVGDAAARLPGRFLRDAALGGEQGQLALGFATLEACGADQAALDALYDLPTGDMLTHIQAWMEFKGSPEAASVGESSGSSS